MPYEAMISEPDSQNPATPLFAVYDSITDTWYELDPELWLDVALQGIDQDAQQLYIDLNEPL